MEEIEEEVRQVIAKQLAKKLDEVTPDASFVEDLGADSLDLIDLIMVLEKSFDIQIPDKDIGMFVKVKDVTEHIKVITRYPL